MKRTIGLFVFIIFLSSTICNAQSILHPDRTGFSLGIGLSSFEKEVFFTEAVSVSPTGHFDISINHSRFDDDFYGFGLQLNIKNSADRIVVPAISFAYISAEGLRGIEVGGSFNFNLVRAKHFAFIPVINGGFFLGAIATHYAGLDLGFAGYIDDLIIISAAPGFIYMDVNTYFVFSAGVSVTPF